MRKVTRDGLEKIDQFVEGQIKVIDEDERFHYPPASVFVNAPLALIQVELTSKMGVLRAVRRLIREAKPRRKAAPKDDDFGRLDSDT